MRDRGGVMCVIESFFCGVCFSLSENMAISLRRGCLGSYVPAVRCGILITIGQGKNLLISYRNA